MELKRTNDCGESFRPDWVSPSAQLIGIQPMTAPITQIYTLRLRYRGPEYDYDYAMQILNQSEKSNT